MALLLLPVIFGCAASPRQEHRVGPATYLTVLGQPGVADGRARFREMLCGGAPEECQEMLVTLADEPPRQPPGRPLPAHDTTLRILFVPGAFQECVRETAVPYEGAMTSLRTMGYQAVEFLVMTLTARP